MKKSVHPQAIMVISSILVSYPNFLRAKNIMVGFGFPKKYGVTPDAVYILGERSNLLHERRL